MKILNKQFTPLEFEKISKEYNSNKPFPNILIQNLFSENILNSTVEAISKFNNVKDKVWYKLCTQGSDFTAFGELTQKLMDFLISEEGVSLVSNITGIKGLISDPNWEGAGINFEPRGSHLELHTDFNRKSLGNLGWRRVNLLLFLSKNWKTEWGGQNELWNEDLSECVQSTNPEFNNLIIFSTSNTSWHGFPPVICPEDQSRKVISCYYYHPTDKGPHKGPQVKTNYVGWGEGRDFEDRRGTGFKEI